jgi:hypothetical protein
VSVPPARRKGDRRGAKLMFLSGVVLPVFFALSIVFDSPGPLLVSLTIFLAGLSLMLYSRMFGEENPTAKSQQTEPSALGTRSGGTALPPASDIGMRGVGEKQVRTAEMIQPPSVTERTTKLLDQE